MDKQLILQKEDSKTFSFQEQEENLIVLNNNSGELLLLNQTSKFMFENCEGKTPDSLINELYDLCNDQENIEYNQMYEECMAAIEDMIAKGMIKIIG